MINCFIQKFLNNEFYIKKNRRLFACDFPFYILFDRYQSIYLQHFAEPDVEVVLQQDL